MTTDFWGGSKTSKKKMKRVGTPFKFGITNSLKSPSKISYLGLKQSKRTNFGGLSGPYGDRDLDGSINKFDCSPNNPGRDGPLKDLLKTFTFGKKEREARKRKAQETGERLTAQRQVKAAKIKQFMQEAPEELSDRARQEYAIQEYEKNKPKDDSNIKELLKQQQKQYVEKLKRLRPSNQPKPQRYSRVLRSARYVLPAGALPSQQRVSFRTAPGKKVYKGSAGAKGGRPVGSYTHIIPGVGPVHVYEWRKWVRQQNALRRYQGQEQISQQAPQLSPQQKYNQAVQRYEQQQMQLQQQPQTEQYPSQQQLQELQTQQSMQEQTPLTNPALEAQDESQLPTTNKFLQQLRRDQAAYQRDIYDRMRNEQPKNFVQKTVAMKRLEQQQAREFAQRNSVLNAHKAMLTPQQNSINFLDTEGSILDTRNNNIMAKRPDHIDILNTGRPNVLQGQRLRQDIQEMNPLNAERLNFGQV